MNPFKKSYRIEEFKNQNGETKFVATYSHLIQRIFINIERVRIYVDRDGDLCGWPSYGYYDSLELAKLAIENRKTKEAEKLKAAYKKSSIHYVE